VLQSTSLCVLDTGNTRTRVYQYMKTIDIYWHMKVLMGHVLVERHEAKQEILSQLDDIQLKINLLDHKMNSIVKQLARMDLTKLDFPQPQVPTTEGRPIT
jgi:hypothetical protein